MLALEGRQRQKSTIFPLPHVDYTIEILADPLDERIEPATVGLENAKVFWMFGAANHFLLSFSDECISKGFSLLKSSTKKTEHIRVYWRSCIALLQKELE